VLYLLVSREDPELRGAVVRFAPPMLVAPALILAAGFFSGTAQAVLWVLALLVDYVGLLVGGVTGWRVDAAHFAERHGLIIIIALGESIVAIGVGAADLDVDGGVILAASFALVVSAALWWSYFDVAALVAARRLAVAEAEHGAYPLPEARVSVFPLEVPDGAWGATGGIIRLPDIYEMAWPPRPDMEGEPREAAARVLAERRRGEAEAVLAAARESPCP
jgi:hypothetical protein